MIRSWPILSLLAVAIADIGASSATGQEAVADLLQQAARAAQRGESEKAIAALSEVIAKEPANSTAWYMRGREHFRVGKIKESVADLDKHVELSPAAESRQWERGISYYYAGEYAKGAKQFALYQTFHDQDVENSVWRYRCVARTEGVEKERENMLPIDNDPRVPMMQIFDLYRGKLKPSEVLAAAQAGNPSRDALNSRLFYASLYVGLWHEAAGEKELAKQHIFEAEKHIIGHYMWDVARVHAQRLRAEKAKE